MQNSDDKSRRKSVLSRFSTAGRQSISKKYQLKLIESETKKLQEEIDKYNGGRNDRRYSEIQSKLIKTSFEVENIRRSFRKRGEDKEAKNYQNALSECIKKMEDKVESNERNSNIELYPINFEGPSSEDLAIRVGRLKRQIDSVSGQSFLQKQEQELLGLSKAVESIDSDLDTKNQLNKTLEDCRQKIINNRHKLLQEITNDIIGGGENKIELHKFFQAYEAVKDRFNDLELEIFKFLQKKGSRNESSQSLKPEEFYRVLEEMQIINLRMERLKKTLKKW